MTQIYEMQLGKIRENLLLMSSLAEQSITRAIQALVERDDQLAANVEDADSQLDQLEVEIDELVITYMATHAPVATDCRFMLAASKISSNLERIGDQATSISRRAIQLNREPQLKPLIDIPAMAGMVQGMLRDAITAFIEHQPELALEVIQRDKDVDAVNHQLARELTTYMGESSANITRCLNLLLVARCLERAADHAANIAEDVYYLHRGHDIRHGRAPL